MSNQRVAAVLALVAAIALTPSLRAASVTLTADDPFGTTSFNSAGKWDSGAAPVAGNDYFTSGFQIRTPSSGTPGPFAGDSLTIGAGGTFLFKTTGVITVGDLILDGGRLANGDPGGDKTGRVAGQITLASDSRIETIDATRHFLITADIVGAAGAALVKNHGGRLTLGGDQHLRRRDDLQRRVHHRQHQRGPGHGDRHDQQRGRAAGTGRRRDAGQ